MGVNEKMKTALQKAKKLWESAEMPRLNDNSNETGKIALAIVAVKIFDNLED